MSIIQAIQHTHESEKAINQSVNQIQFQEHTVFKIDHPTCKAAISLQGAHLLYWYPNTEKTPVIWLSEKALFKKETPIRGGIPICWPWFGKVAEPMHGFARLVDWSLESCQETSQGVDVVLALRDNAQTKKYWPHSFTLEMKLHLGKTCKAELSCSGDFEATTALHSYFGVDDITNVTVKGLGAIYNERLTTKNESKKLGEMTFNQEVDRLYTEPDSVVTIEDGTRKIKLTNHNSSDVVTWNGWIDKTKATPDLDDESYKKFLCVETCRVSKPIKSTSKQKTTYSVEIEVVK